MKFQFSAFLCKPQKKLHISTSAWRLFISVVLALGSAGWLVSQAVKLNSARSRILPADFSEGTLLWLLILAFLCIFCGLALFLKDSFQRYGGAQIFISETYSERELEITLSKSGGKLKFSYVCEFSGLRTSSDNADENGTDCDKMATMTLVLPALRKSGFTMRELRVFSLLPPGSYPSSEDVSPKYSVQIQGRANAYALSNGKKQRLTALQKWLYFGFHSNTLYLGVDEETALQLKEFLSA